MMCRGRQETITPLFLEPDLGLTAAVSNGRSHPLGQVGRLIAGYERTETLSGLYDPTLGNLAYSKH